MHILIVDDNPQVRDLLKNILHSPSNQIFECSDGDEALQAFTTVRPDVVLMDIMMKRKNGIDATKEILRSYPDAKIIILTQHHEPKLRQVALNSGARAFLLKDELYRIQQFILDQKL